MGLVVLVACAPVLIPLIIIMFVLGIKGDEWFNHGKTYHSSSYYYDDDDDFDSFSNYHEEPEVQSSLDDGMFYGGIPMGDSTLYLTDDDDICDEFADEF